ncbi:hypothetical protein [Paludisphaera mucosa]|uniref:Uncharacterized protein n=1 Tax=Paludisphaera mucosa TaxID=3030827 RepID=A0ABT6FC95_9BACT|nr:hypothetical protein [Paludisphaera mucosa]MDG3005212.1 hypothetical protein [Paludisphaera mucosa]
MIRYSAALLAILACGVVDAGDDGQSPVRTWRYPTDNGLTGTIFGRDGADWTEIRPAGEPTSTFKFVRHTNRFTELFDKDRNFTLILYSDGESEWSVGEGWNNWLKGTWEPGTALAVRSHGPIRCRESG